MRAEAQAHVDQIKDALALLRRFLDWDRALRRLDELNLKVEDSSLWDDPKAAQEVMRERRRLEEAISATRAIESELSDTVELMEMAEAEGDNAMVDDGVAALAALAERAERDKISALLAGEADANNSYIEVNAGAGGTESQDWAGMLQRMYTRWAERHGMKVELVDYHSGEQAGIKSATLLIKGENAYGYAKTESGVHRLVRISPYDSAARRHTSFASVWVYPEIDDDIDIEINESELRIDTYRASGAGGQHINTTDSAVRITHLPTGIVVQCQNQRSQHKNKAEAYNQLRARLYERELQIREAAANAENASKDRHRLGPPDPFLCAPALSAGEGPAHRRHLDQPVRCARRRSRRLHGGGAVAARDRRDGRGGGRRMSLARAMLIGALLLTACDAGPAIVKHKPDSVGPFPAADRPVARIVSPRWSTEEARDRLNEAGEVMNKAGIKRGMTVADIGAGEGYYTIRLAARVGKDGRVLAEDIVAGCRDALAERVARERLDNVSVRLGDPANPRLPTGSFDRVLMVHMYHEIEQPYEFLWRMRPSLKRDGLVVVVDANRPTNQHGTPPSLLACEFAAVGYTLVEMEDMPSAGGYLATFRRGRQPVPAGGCQAVQLADPVRQP